MMISWLKKNFIPHTGNGHRPHILRYSSILIILAIILFLEIFSFIIPTLTHLSTTGQMAAVLPAILANLTNEERQTQNLKTLTVNPSLNEAATMKAADMATHSYFAHTSPEGKTPWYWLLQVGYQYQYAGENLAINFSDSKDVTSAWMASPTHKANIVKTNYTEMGTGMASGIYEGHETVFVVQIYANPVPKVFQPIKNKKNDIEKVKEVVSATKTEVTNVLGAETVAATEIGLSKPIKNSTFWQNLLASPRNTMNVVLYIIFIIITTALLLYIFIKIRNHHTDIIKNGLMILAIIGLIFTINYYLSHKDMVIIQSLDYSSENK